MLIGQGSGPTGEAFFIPHASAAASKRDIPIRRYVNTTLFIFLQAGIFFYWAAGPLSQSYFACGYPQFGTPPSPGAYQCTRYDWDWWTIWLMTLNVLLPMMLQFALTNNTIEEYTRLHKWFSMMAIALNIWVFANLTIRWLVFCNTSWSGSSTVCNDYRWCCVYFPSEWCPNTTPCTPAVTAGQLGRNHDIFQHWIFTFVFFVFAIWNYDLNGGLREFGVLR